VVEVPVEAAAPEVVEEEAALEAGVGEAPVPMAVVDEGSPGAMVVEDPANEGAGDAAPGDGPPRPAAGVDAAAVTPVLALVVRNALGASLTPRVSFLEISAPIVLGGGGEC
jgi:hypothetical protein